MVSKAGTVAVRVLEPLIAPEVAVINDEPGVFAVAKPEALMVATLAVPELHVTEVVRSAVEPSLYVPLAANCCVRPAATEGEAGVTLIVFSEGGNLFVPPAPPEQDVKAETASNVKAPRTTRRPAGDERPSIRLLL
jgi:hypothetical protein